MQVLDKISELTGWNNRFAGAFLLAIATSLPEVVSSIQSARLGSFSLVAGILLGSNLFNISILGVADIFIKGNIFSLIDVRNLITCIFLLIISLFIAGAYFLIRHKRYLSLKKIGLLVIFSYVVMMYLIYKI